MPNYHYERDVPLKDAQETAEVLGRYPAKFEWFYRHEQPYRPHPWQVLFHTNTDPTTGRLCRFRHLVAGRRGGKTISAAWELLYYVTHPEQFHYDAHGIDSSRPLHAWILTKDYPTGMAALMTFRMALEQAGYTHGVEYKEHKGNRWFEFENGSFVQFKTADDPETLRGAGLDILWIDEAAFIANERAWEVVRPALSDKLGLVFTTTTPAGKNWFYKEFWGQAGVMEDPAHGRVEYRSIDSTYFNADEWRYLMRTMHPSLFKAEFMASFDAYSGRELLGDWLKYYDPSELPRDGDATGFDSTYQSYNLRRFIGVDPAISLADSADNFAISLIGVTQDNSQAYLLEQWVGKLHFPEQVDKIKEWWLLYRPQIIAIEKTAYQAALAQQVSRIDGLPPVAAIWAKGKKFERILSMAPLFRIGQMRIRKDHVDFIDEWLNYDSTMSNPSDDALDSVEMAIRTAGVLLPPIHAPEDALDMFDVPITDIEELARRDRPSFRRKNTEGVDEHLGGDW